MNWGQSLDKCSTSFCHLKELFPFGFHSNQKLELSSQKNHLQQDFFSQGHQTIKLTPKKSLKKLDMISSSKLTLPKTYHQENSQINIFKYQTLSTIKNQSFKNSNIGRSKSPTAEIIFNYKQAQYFQKYPSSGFSFKDNPLRNTQIIIIQQNMQMNRYNSRPNSSFYKQQSLQYPRSNFTNNQYLDINHSVSGIRSPILNNFLKHNQLRLSRSNQIRVLSPSFKITHQTQLFSQKPICNNMTFLNEETNKRHQNDKICFAHNKIRFMQIKESSPLKSKSLMKKKVIPEPKFINASLSLNIYEDNSKKLKIDSDQFWDDENCYLNKKKTVSVLQLFQPFSNYESIQQENQFNEDSRLVKPICNLQKAKSNNSQINTLDRIKENQQNRQLGYKSGAAQEKNNFNKNRNAGQQFRRVCFSQVNQNPLFIQNSQNFPQVLQSYHKNTNPNKQKMYETQILQEVIPQQNQFQLSCQNSIIFKKSVTFQEQKINGNNALFISETALLTESRHLNNQSILLNNQFRPLNNQFSYLNHQKNFFIQRKGFHQPSIALKLCYNQIRGSQVSNNIQSYSDYTDQEKKNFSYFQKKNEQKQNILNSPIYRQVQQKDKNIIKSYQVYSNNQANKLQIQSNKKKTKIILQNISKNNKIHSDLKRNAFIDLDQKQSNKYIKFYKKNDHHQILTLADQQKTLNSIVDEDEYEKVYATSRTDFFASKNAIDQNSTNKINSPRNMNKHEESTVIGRHCFSKPLFKLL